VQILNRNEWREGVHLVLVYGQRTLKTRLEM
jgi:hypothetical protein